MSVNLQNKNGKRGIEWTDATWNPIKGCEHQCRWTMPDGTIAVCYAEDIANGIAKGSYPRGFDAHYFLPETLDSPKKKKDPLKIFVGSMSDVFGARVPKDHIQAVLDVIRDCPQHTFQMLTKNFPRVDQFELPLNVWIGASMPPDFMFGKALDRHQQERMLRRTLQGLSETKAVVRWMSFEPLSWDVSEIVADFPAALDWAVIGAASSGSKKFPPAESDFEKLRAVLDYHEVPVFYKGNLQSLATATANWREAFPAESFVQDMRNILNHYDVSTVQRRMIK